MNTEYLYYYVKINVPGPLLKENIFLKILKKYFYYKYQTSDAFYYSVQASRILGMWGGGCHNGTLVNNSFPLTLVCLSVSSLTHCPRGAHLV